jgi:SMI1-KNR4 cell-wall
LTMKMRVSNPPVAADVISNFERDRGLSLPKSYASFLRSTNGGAPADNAFPVQDRPHSPIETLHFILGLDAGHPSNTLPYAYDFYVGGFPEGIVPIANEDTGNYVCLDLRDGKERVAFWDKRHFWGTGEWRERDFYHIANSFEEFLSLLRPSPF